MNRCSLVCLIFKPLSKRPYIDAVIARGTRCVFLCVVLVNESSPGRCSVRLQLLPQRSDKAQAQALWHQQCLNTPLLDAAARLPTETIATGRIRTLLCLLFPCLYTAGPVVVIRVTVSTFLKMCSHV